VSGPETDIFKLAKTWTRTHPKCTLLKGGIKYLGPQCAQHGELLHRIFKSVLHPDINSELRIYMFALFDDLVEMGHFGTFLNSISGDIVECILLPNLSWRVGRVASSIRKIALKCCQSMMRDDNVIKSIMTHQCATSLIAIFLSCLEDDESITRNTCCSIFTLICGVQSVLLSEDNANELALALIKRLDDSSNKIRISACEALVKLITRYSMYKERMSIEYIVENLFIHLDDQSVNVRNSVYVCLSGIRDVSPGYVQSLAKKRANHCQNPVLLSKLILKP
jgi:hypothetical protein